MNLEHLIPYRLPAIGSGFFVLHTSVCNSSMVAGVLIAAIFVFVNVLTSVILVFCRGTFPLYIVMKLEDKKRIKDLKK